MVLSFSCGGCSAFTGSTIEQVDSLLHGSARQLSGFRRRGLVVAATTPMLKRQGRHNERTKTDLITAKTTVQQDGRSG